MRASEFLTERRERMYQYIKSLLPTWPDYVLKDWVYGLARGDHQAGVYFKPDADFDRWGFNRETVFKMIADNGLSPDTQWQLVPNMKFTMDMWHPKTQEKLIGRAGGNSDLGMGIPKDKERHAIQNALAKQQGGVRREPVLLIKTPQGYVLLEGWHRTIQHFHMYPDGYTGPAYVAVAQGKPAVAEDAPLPGDFKLMGQGLFLKNLARNLKQRYPKATVKLKGDRVVAYYNKEDDDYLTVMGTEIMDGKYIGIGLDDAFTHSFQGVLVPTIKQTTEQLLAANPGTKPALFLSTDNWNPDAWTHIASKLGYRLVADDESLDENFDDGKNPGRKGLAKRSGINTKASVSTLRNVAKHSTGEKQRMAHWLANMKAGRAKAKK